MSVVRNQPGRSQTRKALSSPYARAPASKRWSITKIFEPLRRVFGQSAEDEEDQEMRRSQSPADQTLIDEPSYVGVDDSQSDAPGPPRSPSKTVSPKRPPPSEGLSPHSTMENVLEFLTDATGTRLKRDEAHSLVNLIHKGIPGEQTVSSSLFQSVGRPLGAVEVEGMISLLRKQVSYERPEPFRFQSATPSRGNSPFSHSSAEQGSSGATPKKTLSRNPNGSYRWQGAGSAKQTPRRNRYASPAFNGTPQLTPQKSASMGDVTQVDGKRRKLEDDKVLSFASSSSTPNFKQLPQQNLPFPISSSSRAAANGSAPAPPPKVSSPSPPPTTPSRLRTSTLPKPTTPSHPSPLRQAWTGNSPNTSQEDLSQADHFKHDHPPPKPTNTASLMSELIKEVTPPKKPDLSNPYQTASPLAKVGPPRRSTRRTRTKPDSPDSKAKEASEQKDAEKEKAEQLKEYPPEAIFEATLPKGSKRSRPPAHLETSPSDSRRSPSPSTSDKSSGKHEEYVVEEVEDDDRVSKKRKDINGSASTSYNKTSDIEIEEIDDSPPPRNGDLLSKDSVPASGSPFGSSGSTNTSNGFGSKSHTFASLKSATAPSRPSKLRFSYQPEASVPSSPTSNPDDASTSGAMDMDAPPPPTIHASFSSLPTIPPKAPTLAKATSRNGAPAKPLDPKAQALAMTVAELPTYVFTLVSQPTPQGHAQARTEAGSKPIPSIPTFDFSREALKAGPTTTNGFNWSAAGIPAPASAAAQWKCSLCNCDNPDSVKDKCTVCDEARPRGSTASEAPKPGFNWGAAGIKPPGPAAAEWVCSLCSCKNPDQAKEKCTVCEAPRPGTAIIPPVSKGFDWAAAGMSPAPSTSASTWKCSLCQLSNPASAKKCTVCEADR